MHETVSRRFSEKNIAAWGMPDLLLIDGGKGQLDAALRAQEERGVSVATMSIAKREEEMIIHKTRSNIGLQRIEELVTSPEQGVMVVDSGEYYIVNLHAGQLNASAHSKNLRGSSIVSSYSDVTKLFQRIRDESHRFAVSYHTVLKRAKQTASSLEEIPGIGPTTRKKLIRQLGSLRAVQAASLEQLSEVVGKAKAEIIVKYLPKS